jgi:hypothetical protein
MRYLIRLLTTLVLAILYDFAMNPVHSTPLPNRLRRENRRSMHIVHPKFILVAPLTARDLSMAPRLRPHSWVGGLGCPHRPALWEIFSVRLGDELPDDLGLRGSKLLDELLERGL